MTDVINRILGSILILAIMAVILSKNTQFTTLLTNTFKALTSWITAVEVAPTTQGSKQ
ncbi:MAG: hypothetical protein WDN46_12930 [Methylocella sp.]